MLTAAPRPEHDAIPHRRYRSRSTNWQQLFPPAPPAPLRYELRAFVGSFDQLQQRVLLPRPGHSGLLAQAACAPPRDPSRAATCRVGGGRNRV